MCAIIWSLSVGLEGSGNLSEISNLDPAIRRECWLLMHRVVMMFLSGIVSSEELPSMSPMILCVVCAEFFLSSCWKR